MRKIVITPLPKQLQLESPTQLGQLVRSVRTTSGLTLEETALAIGIAKQTLQNLEKGTGTVSLALTFQVLAELGIHLHWSVSSTGGTDREFSYAT